MGFYKVKIGSVLGRASLGIAIIDLYLCFTVIVMQSRLLHILLTTIDGGLTLATPRAIAIGSLSVSCFVALMAIFLMIAVIGKRSSLINVWLWLNLISTGSVVGLSVAALCSPFYIFTPYIAVPAVVRLSQCWVIYEYRRQIVTVNKGIISQQIGNVAY